MRSKFYLSFIAALAFGSMSLQAQVIATIAGTGSTGYSGDGGLAVHAQFNNCTGVSFDGAGNVYIADRDNNVVRKINTIGIVTTFAGNGTAGYGGDGGAAIAAKLNKPTNVATDAAGNVYIADNGNNVIRKIAPGGVISTYAGNGMAGYNGDADSARFASLNNPQGIAVDADGNLFIADAGNHVVRMVDADRVISTVAGSGMLGSAGNGGMATDASLSNPASVAVDAAGNLYIADYLNNTVRKVDAATGVIANVAGSGLTGNSGDGGPAVNAKLKFPSGVSVDGAGNVFIADQGNNIIRKVTAAGMISTLAGSNTNGYTGDGGAPTLAQLNSPKDVAVDGWGRIYIADYGNDVVRVIAKPTTVDPMSASPVLLVYPNPASATFTVSLRSALGNGSLTLMDVTGRIIEARTVTGGAKEAFMVSKLQAGNYVLQFAEGGNIYTEKISVAH